MTILENNCVQSIATAAGYMTGPLISGLAAYMWATNDVLPLWQIVCFTVVLSILGVLVAFPMKRRFINDEQHPFPEGRACGVVLDTLYERAEAAGGMFKAKVLSIAAALAGGVSFISGENFMHLVQERWLGLQSLVAPAAQPRRLVLLAGRKGTRAAAEARGRGRAPARALPHVRFRDDRRRGPDGHPHGGQPAARRGRSIT